MRNGKKEKRELKFKKESKCEKFFLQKMKQNKW